ncbi:phosphatase PAP2 family protein [Salinibacterium hongtaonis]|uniref:PAP2 family protein n=1 Tax=Homoserinimonas hongtaonis TaxID=2079791 RepID=A0A2U1T0R1_9MICO|nr:phosphatase PAP2 family protein [Salinibacterium hongtaonis]AWB89900.1 phosphatase PAP2 family protein [Salinibacterium hongtaonis]PWB97363.1 PAP2 family protein [Salinibacterium hongtaonis]
MEPRESRAVTNRWPLISGIVALVVAVSLGGLIAARNSGSPLGVDLGWLDAMLNYRSDALDALSLFLDWLGGGIVGIFVVPIVTVIVLCLLRRMWAALYYLIAAIASAGAVQLLKGLYLRPRPEDIMVVADVGSFPSGHVANAATIAVTLGIIVGRTWVWAAGAVYTVLMMVARTYLGAHWISDTVGGLLVGAGVAIIVWAPFAARIAAERERLSNRPAVTRTSE